MKDDPGYDVISFWAKGGVQRDMSPRGVLMPSPVTVGDSACGMALAMGICAAMCRKPTTGEGSYVSTSLLSAALYLNNDCFIESQYGDIYPRAHNTSRRALMNTYQCKDGEWVSILTVSFDKAFASMTSDEAIARLKPVDIGLCKVQSTLDTMEDEQVLANKFIVDILQRTASISGCPRPPRGSPTARSTSLWLRCRAPSWAQTPARF